jgi:hypothetical protein
LGQLSERLSYDKLYQDAVKDPTLRRTKQELEVAVENAQTARQVVWELFQELESFRLDDYRAFDDGGRGMQRLVAYCRAGVAEVGGRFESHGNTRFRAQMDGQPEYLISIDRDEAKDREDLSLLGLEHPVVRHLIERHRNLDATRRGLAGTFPSAGGTKGILTFWHIQIHGTGGQFHQGVVPLGVDEQGERCRAVEQLADTIRELLKFDTAILEPDERRRLASSVLPEMLRRELSYQGLLNDDASFSSKLLAWIEIGSRKES